MHLPRKNILLKFQALQFCGCRSSDSALLLRLISIPFEQLLFCLGEIQGVKAKVSEEFEKWSDEVPKDIKLTVVHQLGQEKKGGSGTGVTELLGMRVFNNGISHSMQDECWTGHPRYGIYISEPLCYHVLSDEAHKLIFNYSSDRGVRADKYQSTWAFLAGQVAGRTTSDGPSTYNHIAFLPP